jgi:flagellar biogenesis protein FliO
MRVFIAAISVALIVAPLRAQGAGSVPAAAGMESEARANAAVSVEPAAQEDRVLGPWPGATAAAGAGTTERPVPEAAGRGWGGLGAGEILRVSAALAVVLALLIGARVLLRRVGGALRGGGRPGGIMNILGRYPVARGQSLVLLRLGAGRIVLVHQSRSSMTTLAEVSDPDEIARLVARIEAGAVRGGRGTGSGRFQALLGRLAAEDEAREVLPPSSGAEVVDLTRRSWRRAAARKGQA